MISVEIRALIRKKNDNSKILHFGGKGNTPASSIIDGNGCLYVSGAGGVTKGGIHDLTRRFLKVVKSGSVSVEEAERILKKESYEEMGYAKLDTSRKARTGFAEVIYCSNKADEHLLNIFERLYREDGEVFGTRASQSQYELVKEKFPEVEYDPISRILKIEKKDKKRIGKIAVCSAGTADIPVAEEAAQTAEYFGTNVERIYDVGVQRNASSVFQTGDDSECELCSCSCGNGGSSCQCDGRSGEQTCDRSPHICGVWCKYAWSFCTSYYDQFLCERYCGGEY